MNLTQEDLRQIAVLLDQKLDTKSGSINNELKKLREGVREIHSMVSRLQLGTTNKFK